MITGELAEVSVKAHVPLIAAEFGYWQLGITQANSTTSAKSNNRVLTLLGVPLTQG
jgi:hypothetical protein